MQKVLSYYIHLNADADNAENSDDAVQAFLARQRCRIRATENARDEGPVVTDFES